MKTLKVISILFILFIVYNSNAQTIKRVLFIGNSYTLVNNLPQLTATIASSMGDSLIFDSHAIGGYTLQQHASDTATLNKIMLGNWDYVVLQEQSQLPSFPDSQVAAQVYPYAKFLDSMIKAYNPCGRTIFYMTWGREFGDTSNCAFFPPLCTYIGMDSLLRLRYMIMADSNHAEVSPVGAVWRNIRTYYPSIPLYQPDQSHPTAEGSYAAGCSFYTVIFRKDPLLIPYNYSLTPTEADSIKTAASHVVFDSFSTWNINLFDPVSNFTYTIYGTDTVVFNNSSANATSYIWNFGDSTTDTSKNPTHIYTSGGHHIATLIASHCGFSDPISFAVPFYTMAINNNKISPSYIVIYPNPVKDNLYINCCNKELQLTVINMYGQILMVKATKLNDLIELDFSNLAIGIYNLKITENGISNVYKITKI